MNPIVFSLRNPALVHALVIAITVCGTYSFLEMSRELNPKIDYNWIFLVTHYPGASPEEVERLISIPIEREVAGIRFLKSIATESEPGLSSVILQLEDLSSPEFDRKIEEARALVTRVELPQGAGEIEVRPLSSYDFQPVVSVAVSGGTAGRRLYDVAQQIIEDLKDIQGVDRVETIGERQRAVLVELEPHRLEAFGLGILEVEEALANADSSQPAGLLKTESRELLLRAQGKIDGPSDVASIPLRGDPRENILTVGDLGTVSDGFLDRERIARFNGEPAVTIGVIKNEHGNTIEILNAIHDLVEEWQRYLPAEISVDLYHDESLIIKRSLSVLESNGLLGLVLVIVGMTILIGWRAALCAALGIPITFLLSIVILDWTGQSLNGSTLFGLILVLGLVVDDAIVVLENCYRHLQAGKQLDQAAVDGTLEVMAPVVTSTLTTIAGFLPLILMPGVAGELMRIVPITVGIVLLVSLLESFCILPNHFATMLRSYKGHREDEILGLWKKLYQRALDVVLRNRYRATALVGCLLVLSLLLIPSIGIELFAGEEVSTVGILLTLPMGVPIEQTEQVVCEIQRALAELPNHEVEAVVAHIGFQQRSDDWLHGSYLAQIWVDVTEPEARDRSLDEIAQELRFRAGRVAGPQEVQIRTLDGSPPTDAPVELLIKGSDLAEIDEVASLLGDELRRLPGVQDVYADNLDRQPKVDVVINRAAAARSGLDTSRISRSVQAAFGGISAATWYDGDEELDVVVRLADSYRHDPEVLASLRIASPNGSLIPLAEIAEVVEGESPQTLRRRDGHQALTLSAEVDEDESDIRSINSHMTDYFQRIRANYPSVRVEDGGQWRAFVDSFKSLLILFGFGLMLILLILINQFKNWSQPLIVLAVVPLSFVGAVCSLLLFQEPFSITTLYGLVALAGIAVNDSIMLIAFLNQLRREGVDGHLSIIEAASVRLRPILITSATTVLGLLPMALGAGGATQVWQPLASTVVGGVVVATLISLLVVPCFQAILDDLWILFRARSYKS